jgi:hypothetical protein
VRGREPKEGGVEGRGTREGGMGDREPREGKRQLGGSMYVLKDESQRSKVTGTHFLSRA